MQTQKFNITGMTCAACQANITRNVSKLPASKTSTSAPGQPDDRNL